MKLEEKIQRLPLDSGVYIMRDVAGTIIYVGKAVVLKNRVRQYFTCSQKDVKVQAMVDNVADFDYIITLTEKDALSLEANLIRKFKPKYNILLKDDKSSPYIRIDTALDFPTIEITRRVKKDGTKYFGPFFNGIYVNDIVEIIKSAYKIRTCKKHLVFSKRECLNYHINLCHAPCCKRISHDEYMEVVSKVIAFLSGREDAAERLITQKMNDAVQIEDFERAISYRNHLEMLKKLREKTLSDLGSDLDIDALAFATDLSHFTVSVCIVRGGKMMGVNNYNIDGAYTSEEEAMTDFITQYYSPTSFIPPLVCLENEFDVSALSDYLTLINRKKTEVVFPKIGTKKRIVQMAKKNAEDYLALSSDKIEHEKDMTIRAADELCGILNIKSARRIECYDISNISGVDKVASGIVFIDGAADKAEYRRYKIKTVEGANDFECMAEVLSRRLNRANEGDEKFSDLPDLIVIDGGKGQLKFASDAMRKAGFEIDMISLAEREEHIFTLHSPDPIILPKTGYPLKLLQRVRDEAHRFAITYHRNLRSKRYSSSLDKIKGVGKVKRRILLTHFKNLGEIKSADIATLEAVKGIDRRTAESVYNFFKSENIETTFKN